MDNQIEICPHCNIREVEMDDLGYYGCIQCMNTKFKKATKKALQKSFDQDLTGQDEEVYYGRSN